MRAIQDILFLRGDISPFLIHLTRHVNDNTAGENLEAIINCKFLMPGDPAMSDARFAMPFVDDIAERRMLFSAVSFTETPLSEVQTLLEIAGRQVNLEPYGLVFLKERLKRKGVSPVIYINNHTGDKDRVVQALASLRTSNQQAAYQILPLVAIFGRKLQPVGASAATQGEVDFTWEREWRFPEANGLFQFDADDVFIGLCPHNEIDRFEGLFPSVGFIDPTRNMKWYANKLIQARQRVDMRYSVV